MKNGKERKWSALVLMFALFTPGLIADDKKWAEWTNYDRILAIQRFLNAVYPGLRKEKGLLTFRTMEFNIAPVDSLYVSFVPCRVGSGVSGDGRPLSPPNCSGFLDSGTSTFLHFTIATGPHRYPIQHFVAGGDFMAAKFEALVKAITDHPEWTEKEILDALNREHPKFGPDNRAGFLKTIPAATIYEFSGCRLTVGDAQYLPMGVKWSVPGTYRWRRRTYPCNAAFEPFEGNLLGIDRV
jgi:hypothetical protein